jgi:hypothetical protein
MFTLQHPYAPTVNYRCSLPEAIASYATDHLDGFDVYVIEVADSAHGIGIEVFEKDTDTSLGIVSIH